MENADYSIILDVTDMSAPVSLNVKQGDAGRVIAVNLARDGVPVGIEPGSYAVFAGKKPDEKILWNSCSIRDSTIFYEITKQTTAVVGWVPVQIRLYRPGGKLVSSPDFVLIVDGTVTDDEEVVIVSENEVTALTELVSEAADAIEHALNVEGKSAYQVAQEAGFEGTVEEWLDSLVGPKGDKGDPGPQGPQGPQGDPGKDGGSTTITLKYGVSSTPSMNTITGWQDTIPQMSETYPYLWIEISTETTTATGGSNTVEAGIIGYYSTPDSGGNVDQSGLSATEKKLMLTLFKNAGYEDDSMLDTYNELATLWGGETVEPEEPDEPVVPDEPDEPEKTLTSISATYSGGDVAVGTAVTDLTGIVVTAHYSDGTNEIVTGYTLSGTIAEGSNTVTVSYGGKTTTFSVTGVAESGGDGNFISIPVTQNTSRAIARNLYADGGTTLLREDAFSSWCWTSDEIFDADTRVKFLVTPGWTNTRNSSIFVGSTMTGSEVYFAEGVKGETTGDASYVGGSAVERIVTVKAGHKAILVYSNGTAVTAAMEADIVRCTGISLSADTLEFTGAGSKTLIATVTPNNCTEPVFWDSSNPDIVTVENGAVTALNNGKETITARCGAYSASCAVSASGFVVKPIYPFSDGTCSVVGNDDVTPSGTITITDGNHINMVRPWAYGAVIPATNLPEQSRWGRLGETLSNQSTIFPLKTGDKVKTVVTFSGSNTHVAGLSVRLFTANATNTFIDIFDNITESGETTYTAESDMDVGGIGLCIASGTGVLDCDIEIYVNGARYV